MARTDGKVESQHTVPRMLLRNFGFQGRGKQLQIHVFDKQTSRVFQSGLDGVVAERGFYDFPDGDASFEPLLADLEAKTAAAFTKVLAARDLSALDGEDAAWVATFVAAQHLRSKNFREAARALDVAIADRIKRMGGDPEKVKGWSPFKGEGDVKAFALVMLGKLGRELSERLLGKSWVLFETEPTTPFWLSDNPVVLHNDRDMEPYGNIGFSVPGIQVYLPLSPTLMLGLWCQTHEYVFRAAAQDGRLSFERIAGGIRATPDYNASVDEAVLREIGRAKLGSLETLLENIDHGRATRCSEREVMFFNSLQVLYSERYLLSAQPDFGMAQKMLDENPSRRRGMRFRL